MLHEYDWAISCHETDVILDVLEECSPERRDLDILQCDKLSRQRLVYALQTFSVIEDIPKKRVFVCPFRLHSTTPSHGNYTMNPEEKEVQKSVCKGHPTIEPALLIASSSSKKAAGK